MDTYFEELGRGVLDSWKRANFSLEAFPKIACRALEARPPAKHVDLPELMRGFLLDDDQPLQTDSDFGQPEIVAFSHPRFYIQLLFWLDGTTAIHQHEFSGAFHVMHGSSIHAHYEFEKARAVTPFLRVGNLRTKNIELLEAGRTVPIVSGQRTIHSLFHLDSPSVTVVVRTQHDPGTGPQFNYLPPHLAVDPLLRDSLSARRKQLLDVLEQTEDDAYPQLVLQMIGELDFERGFYVLQHSMLYLQALEEWTPAIKAFEKKHGALANGVAATLREEARRSVIKGLRSSIIEPEHRFFLALLMNASTQSEILSLVKRRFPGKPPTAIILRWAEELLDVSDGWASIFDVMFPESLGVEYEYQPMVLLAAFSHFMKGGKKLPAEFEGMSSRDLKELHAVFAQSVLGPLAFT
jgi:hypothetical protein